MASSCSVSRIQSATNVIRMELSNRISFPHDVLSLVVQLLIKNGRVDIRKRTTSMRFSSPKATHSCSSPESKTSLISPHQLQLSISYMKIMLSYVSCRFPFLVRGTWVYSMRLLLQCMCSMEYVIFSLLRSLAQAAHSVRLILQTV